LIFRGTASASDSRYYVAWGFAEVLPNRVTILAESAEKPGDIDAVAVQRELERGQKMWDQAGDSAARYERANELIHDAESRLDAKGGGH
jgi:F-type H+-transporting ATPase subunit epsilon